MTEVVKVATKEEVPPGTAIMVTAVGEEIGLFNLNGTFCAIGNQCTHSGGPLCEGDISGEEVTCPWHGAVFNIRTGKAVTAPANADVPCFKVIVEGNDIKVEVP